MLPLTFVASTKSSLLSDRFRIAVPIMVSEKPDRINVGGVYKIYTGFDYGFDLFINFLLAQIAHVTEKTFSTIIHSA
jgi:hypothetical protein